MNPRITYDDRNVIYRDDSSLYELNELEYGGSKVFIRQAANPADSQDVCNKPPDYWKPVPINKFFTKTHNNCIVKTIEIIRP